MAPAFRTNTASNASVCVRQGLVPSRRLHGAARPKLAACRTPERTCRRVQAIAAPPEAGITIDKEEEAIFAALERQLPVPNNSSTSATGRKIQVVVLGSGWGAASFLKNIDAEAFGPEGPYELTIISPRNYFLYTPLLPAAAGGAVEERSIVEPIRTLAQGKAHYFEATCRKVDVRKRMLYCKKQHCDVCETKGKDANCNPCERYSAHFSLPYDILITAVGSRNATFGIAGVRDHAYFLKTVDDAKRLRLHLSKAIEGAGLPNISPEERKRLLSVVVVGGGPTGVEAAAEVHDFIEEDVHRLFPHLEGQTSVTVVASADRLLNVYSKEVADYATEWLQKNGITTLLKCKATDVQPGALTVQLADGTVTQLPYGTLVWATGIEAHPLVKHIRAQMPRSEQTAARGLLVNGNLQVRGSSGNIFCIGDAAATGDAPVDQLPATAQVARQQAEYLAKLFNRRLISLDDSTSFGPRPSAKPSTSRCGSGCASGCASTAGCSSSSDSEGSGGEGSGSDQDEAVYYEATVVLPAGTKPFSYLHMGQLAYLGRDSGVLDLPGSQHLPPGLRALKGFLAGLTWRGMETVMQVSLRNQVMVAADMLRTRIFGRNISNV